MSEIMAQKKQEEIEEVLQRDKADKSRIMGDICPLCGTRPTAYPYICFLPSPYGWLECASCGTIFAPKSIRDQKIAATVQKVEKAVPLITGIGEIRTDGK
jgi:uncharacterized OB-fold protein